MLSDSPQTAGVLQQQCAFEVRPLYFPVYPLISVSITSNCLYNRQAVFNEIGGIITTLFLSSIASFL